MNVLSCESAATAAPPMETTPLPRDKAAFSAHQKQSVQRNNWEMREGFAGFCGFSHVDARTREGKHARDSCFHPRVRTFDANDVQTMHKMAPSATTKEAPSCAYYAHN